MADDWLPDRYRTNGSLFIIILSVRVISTRHHGTLSVPVISTRHHGTLSVPVISTRHHGVIRTLSVHVIMVRYQYPLSWYVSTRYQYTSSGHIISTRYQYTSSGHIISTALSVRVIMAHYQYMLSARDITSRKIGVTVSCPYFTRHQLWWWQYSLDVITVHILCHHHHHHHHHQLWWWWRIMWTVITSTTNVINSDDDVICERYSRHVVTVHN